MDGIEWTRNFIGVLENNKRIGKQDEFEKLYLPHLQYLLDAIDRLNGELAACREENKRLYENYQCLEKQIQEDFNNYEAGLCIKCLLDRHKAAQPKDATTWEEGRMIHVLLSVCIGIMGLCFAAYLDKIVGVAAPPIYFAIGFVTMFLIALVAGDA
jgi:hypothetical protein